MNVNEMKYAKVMDFPLMLLLCFCSSDPGGGGAYLWACPQPTVGGSRCRHSQPSSPGGQDLPGSNPSLCQDLLTKSKLQQSAAQIDKTELFTLTDWLLIFCPPSLRPWCVGVDQTDQDQREVSDKAS